MHSFMNAIDDITDGACVCKTALPSLRLMHVHSHVRTHAHTHTHTHTALEFSHIDLFIISGLITLTFVLPAISSHFLVLQLHFLFSCTYDGLK